jgi:hypothetical protein
LANLLGDAERTCQWLLSRPHGDNPRTDCQ